jgi:hypothetical protein
MEQLEKDFDDGAQPINLRYGVNSAAFQLISFKTKNTLAAEPFK